MTTVYLIRHSVRLKTNLIEEYKTLQSSLIKNEKIVLSPEGENRARILSEEKELENIDAIYCSNMVRTIATAKYLCDRQGLKINIDDRFDERRIGIPNDDIFPDWFQRQFLNENFKTEGGESMKDVQKRFSAALFEVISKNKDKRIAVFTHGNAITFFLLKYGELISVDDEQKVTIKFKNKIILNKKINAPEVFKLTFNGNEIKSIELIEFSDLPFMEGV